jgi:formamidopyrimidine-DNA glycosylase
VVVVIGNSAFQDICFRARLHPKRRGASVNSERRGGLVDAFSSLVAERLHAGGKAGFVDMYGSPGRYEPLMGPNRKNGPCLRCGIESVAVGGGRAY